MTRAADETPAPATTHRYAVISAYYKEPRETLERCIASVRKQSIQADHIMVADGFPQDWIDGAGVRHLRLDRAHGDYGNTPRAMGALLAIAEQYDGLCFLDADNWLEPTHVDECVRTYERGGQQHHVDFVVARRHFRRPDESIIEIEQEAFDVHVDTSCFFFFPSSFHLIPHFGMMPKKLSAIGDRVFYHSLNTRGLKSAICEATTVNYLCMWETVYRNMGETPPPDAKPVINARPIFDWLDNRSPEERLLISRLSGTVA
jgi:cellulose synthase/poly-beta-1,6-N-acetylglucosamine synthase-like glycosyltransferase